MLAARAGVAEGLDGDVADLARKSGGALVGLAVQHEAAADPGPRRDEQNVRKTAGGAVLHLGESRRRGVVHDADVHPQRLFKSGLCVDVAQRGEVRRGGEAARMTIDQAGHGNAGRPGFGMGIEFAAQTRELGAKSVKRVVADGRLAPADDVEITEGDGLDESAADVEAEGEHDRKPQCYQRAPAGGAKARLPMRP